MAATDWATLLTDVPTQAQVAIAAAVPIGVGVLVLRMAPGLVLSILSKFGVRK